MTSMKFATKSHGFTVSEIYCYLLLRNLLLFTVSGIYHLPSQEFNICNVPATIRCLLNFTSFLKSHCIRFGTKSWQSWAYFSPWPAWKKIIKFLAFSCNCKKNLNFCILSHWDHSCEMTEKQLFLSISFFLYKYTIHILVHFLSRMQNYIIFKGLKVYMLLFPNIFWTKYKVWKTTSYSKNTNLFET